MGTTKIKIIDLSSEQPAVKASQKHAQSLGSANKIKKESSEHSAKSEKPIPVIPERSGGISSLILGSVTTPESEVADSGQARMTKEELASSPPTSNEVVAGPRSDVKTKSKAPKAQKHHLGKKYKEALEKIEKDKLYPADQALELLTKTSYTKFDPSVEIHLGINVKSLHGSVNFPHSIGPKKEKKYLIFSEKKVADVKNVIWAGADSIADIESGKLKPNRDFSAVIASPKFMPHLAKVAKILGPAGMMPNPKANTITENPAKAIAEESASGSQFQTDPTAPIIHTKIGKLSEKSENLKENLKALILAVGPTKIKKATITTTMGPGIKIDLSSLET